jgi:hypothetical protein
MNMGGSVVARNKVTLPTKLLSDTKALDYHVLESNAVRPPLIGSSTLEALGATMQFAQMNDNLTSSAGRGTLRKIDGVWTTDVFVDHVQQQKYNNEGPMRSVKKSACATTTHECQHDDSHSSSSETPSQVAVDNAGPLRVSEGEGREGVWLVRARRGVRPALW